MSRFLTILFSFATITRALAQPPDTLWTSVLEGFGDDTASVIRQTSDGGYVIAGRSVSIGQSDGDFLIIKTNLVGGSEWQYTYGDSANNVSFDIRECVNGGYVVTGTTFLPGLNLREAVVFRLTSDGSLLWSHSYNYSLGTSAKAILEVEPESFLVAGAAIDSGQYANWGRWHMLLNAEGDTVWTRSTDGFQYPVAAGTSTFTSLEHVSANIAMVFGRYVYSWLDAGGIFHIEGQALRLTISAAGDTLQSLAMGGIVAYEFKSTSERGVLIAGGPQFSSSLHNVLQENDSLGALLWRRNLPWSIVDLAEGPDDGYLLLHADNGAVVSGYDANHAQVFVTTYGADLIAIPTALINTADSGCVILAKFGSAGSQDILIVKTEPILALPADGSFILPPSSFSLSSHPNPFNPATTISFALPKAENVKLSIYDITGRLVAVLADERYPAGEHQLNFNGTDLPSGIYFARLSAGAHEMMQKLLLVK